jgi:hypothetical protein
MIIKSQLLINQKLIYLKVISGITFVLLIMQTYFYKFSISITFIALSCILAIWGLVWARKWYLKRKKFNA